MKIPAYRPGHWVLRPESMDQDIVVPTVVDQIKAYCNVRGFIFNRPEWSIDLKFPPQHLAGIPINMQILKYLRWIEKHDEKGVYRHLIAIYCSYDLSQECIRIDRGSEYMNIMCPHLHQLQNFLEVFVPEWQYSLDALPDLYYTQNS